VALTLTLFYCDDAQKACKLRTLRLRAPFEIKEGGATSLTVKSEL
jgi:hypothetical protein